MRFDEFRTEMQDFVAGFKMQFAYDSLKFSSSHKQFG